MKQGAILIAGSSCLIGLAAVEHFDRQGHDVFGVDNNMRRIDETCRIDRTLHSLFGASKVAAV